MKEFWNAQRCFNIAKVLIPVIILMFIFATICFAYYRAKYTESAHGDSTDGVNRASLTSPVNFGYSKGNCAHCHEQHASIGGAEPTPPVAGGAEDFLLFSSNNPSSQTDNFCFQCHKSGSTIQTVTNYTYSRNFGGGPITFSNIYDAFNPPSGSTPSSHNLSDVLSHIVSRGGGFTSDVNACVVCHDPHIAQKQFPVASSGSKGGVFTSIRRAIDYQGNPGNLWGDENNTSSGSLNELTSEATSLYKAPCYTGGAWPCSDAVNGPFEPANDGVSDGSNLPNYYNLCMNNCHERADVTSTERGGNLRQIDWSSNPPLGDEHGQKYDSGFSIYGSRVNPYVGADTNYVLTCTDCHEPHGSQNEWLLRTTVNGTNVSVVTNNCWLNFCSACHNITSHSGTPWNNTTCDCYSSGNCHRHGRLSMF